MTRGTLVRRSMQQETLWDKIADKFNTYKKDGVWYGALDNIITAWPAVLGFVNENFTDTKGRKALDFGCGTGMFCRELKNLGFETTGVDISPEMIKIGQQNLEGVSLYVGDAGFARSLAEQRGAFDLVTSIMCMQFVEDDGVKSLAQAVASGGCMVCVNHNPLHLEERGLDRRFNLTGTDVIVPVYKRTAEDYDNLLAEYGMERLLETYLQENKKVLEQQGVKRDLKHPKYMVLAYKKR
jgi:2-polyprenyl-3-methyl-5-hydroxy-6-metoxy-1,4-benzoquinol methylase